MISRSGSKVVPKYKKTHTEEDRRAETKRIGEQYKDVVPIICEAHPSSSLAMTDHIKFIGETKTTVQKLINNLKKKIKLKEDQSLYLFVESKVLKSGMNHLFE